jgi:hypothetical protein
MNKKRIVLISLIFLMAVSSLSMVSAGWFNFGSDKVDTYMFFDYRYSKSAESDQASVILDANYTNGTHEELVNKTIDVNVTDENGTSKSYSVTSIDGYVPICNLTPGNYTISAVFKGDDKYNFSNLTEKKEIKKTIHLTGKTAELRNDEGDLVGHLYY